MDTDVKVKPGAGHAVHRPGRTRRAEDAARMLIGELARRTGCTPRMIRHYERRGLLTGRRLPNGYRDFPPEAVARVERIRTLLAAGMDLAAAGPLLGCFTEEGRTVACDGLRRRVGEEIAAIDEQQHRLERTRAALHELLDGASRSLTNDVEAPAGPGRHPHDSNDRAPGPAGAAGVCEGSGQTSNL